MSKNIFSYLPDGTPDLNDKLIGSASEDNTTYNYKLRTIFNLLDTLYQKEVLVFQYASSSNPLTAANDGYFSSNSELPLNLSQIIVNSISYNGEDTTALMDALVVTIQSESINFSIVNATDPSNFISFTATAITKVSNTYVIDGSLSGSFYSGNLIDGEVYFTEPNLIVEGLNNIVEDLSPQLGGVLDENGYGIKIIEEVKSVTAGDLLSSRDGGTGVITNSASNASEGSNNTGRLSIALSTSASGDQPILTRGIYNSVGAFTGGAAYYMDNTSGGITTDTSAFADSDIIRRIGYAIDDDNLYFNPSNSWVTKDGTKNNDITVGAMRWAGIWTTPPYEFNEVLIDEGWLGVVTNPAGTSDRLAPQTDGSSEWALDPELAFSTASDSSVVKQVHNYTLTKGGYGQILQIKTPVWDLDSVTRVTVINNTTGETTVYNNPVLSSGEWTTLRVTNTPVPIGTMFSIWYEYYNSTDANEITGGWTSNVGTGMPASQQFNIDDLDNATVIEISHTDLDSTNRGTELDGVAAGSIINISETSDSSRSTEVEVVSVDLTSTTSTKYTVTLIANGSKDIRDGKTCTINIDVPITQPSQYYSETDYYLGTTNQPSFATVDTELYYGGVLQASTTDAYGINFQFQSASISEDYGYMASSESSTTGGGGAVVINEDLDFNDYGIVGLRDLTFTDGNVISWNDDFHTINIPSLNGSVTQVGQELGFIVYNNTGVAIPNGAVVKPTGAIVVGSEVIPTVILAKADNHATCEGTLFVITSDNPDASLGVATRFGRVGDLDLSSFAGGDDLFLSPTVAGVLQNTRPEFPDYVIGVGGVINNHATEGVMGVSFTRSVKETILNAWDGGFRESIDFFVSSDGATITGTLNQSGGGDLTMMFSDGFTTLDCTPEKTITLVAGTDTLPQANYVYIPKTTKVLTVSTSDFPTGEHIKVADILLRSASNTQTYDALCNRNWNDHVKGASDNGHLLHIAEKIRQGFATWDSGVEATCTVTSPTSSDVWVSNTSGTVYQLHKQTFLDQDTSTGDVVSVINHFTTPLLDTSNLNGLDENALGDSLAGKSFSFVLWGIQNKTSETSHLMLNLPIGSYSKTSPNSAVNDALNYTVYDIPDEYRGKGFLIARFTFILQNNGTDWELYDTEDLRGSIPNITAGGGAGGTGVTTWLALEDTDNTYVGAAGKVPTVNSGETALELASLPMELYFAGGDETSDIAIATGVISFHMPNYATTLTGISVDVATAPTGSSATFDLNEGGTSVLSTKVTIDAGELTSETAATPPVISDSGLAANAVITLDIDGVGSTVAGAGVKCRIYYTRA